MVPMCSGVSLVTSSWRRHDYADDAINFFGNVNLIGPVPDQFLQQSGAPQDAQLVIGQGLER